MSRKRSLKETFFCWLATIIGFVVALIPTWFYILAKVLLAPQGFWQNFLLLGVGLFFLGGLQLVLVIIFL